MGNVYLGHDTRLDRAVAIKVLPAALAAGPEHVQRFKREAQSIAALNHPNIVAVATRTLRLPPCNGPARWTISSAWRWSTYPLTSKRYARVLWCRSF